MLIFILVTNTKHNNSLILEPIYTTMNNLYTNFKLFN